MNRARDLRRLGALASLLSEAGLSRLAGALAARNRTEGLLAALTDAPPSGEVEPAAALRNAAVYAAWIEHRRRALAAQLAQETARVDDARATAARAFGRAQALGRLESVAHRPRVATPD